MVISPVLVIGGGVAGSAFARMAAEHGFRVHVYERRNRLGGMAERLSGGCVIKLHDPAMTEFALAGKFIRAFTKLERAPDTWPWVYYPVGGYHWMCEDWLYHPEIRVLKNAAIQNAYVCTDSYKFVYNTGSLDSLFYNMYGELAYPLGFPMVQDELEVNRYLRYKSLVDEMGMYSFGAQGGYSVLTIEGAILAAYGALQHLLGRVNGVWNYVRS